MITRDEYTNIVYALGISLGTRSGTEGATPEVVEMAKGHLKILDKLEKFVE